tara:strand:- start:852 stop:1700 length:849 start_codon:yes stop_codon:yes gene_type:complete
MSSNKKQTEEKPRRSYTVKVYVDNHVPPPANSKIGEKWSIGFDDRGYHWTKIVAANKREEAVEKIVKWFRAGKCRAKNHPNGEIHKAFHSKKVDEIAVVSDDYNEVFYNDFIRGFLAKYRLLPQEKIDELIDKSKGQLEQITDFENCKGYGCIRWNNFRKIKKVRERFEKTPAQFLYKEVKTGAYWALIQVRPQVTEGTEVKYLGAERKGSLWVRPIWETKTGKITQFSKRKRFKLKSVEFFKAAQEARKLADEYKEKLDKEYGKRRGHKKVIVESKKQTQI